MARSRLSTVNFGSSKTGLLTVGYTLFNPDGSTYQARATTGVVEYTTSGVYGANVSLPTDRAVLVMWDTGESPPRYGNEDNNVQLDTIAESTDLIRLIWNSIKNQGGVFTVILEKLGLLEKNKGLAKSDIEDVVGPANQKALITISGLGDQIKALRAEPAKVDTTKIEELVGGLNTKMDQMPKYDANFKGIGEMIETAILKIQSTVKTEGVVSTASEKARSEALMAELKRLQAVFTRFDTLMSKINDFNKKLAELGDNDKTILKDKEKIHAEIKSVNDIVNAIAVLNRVPTRNSTNDLLIMAHGGRRK